MRSTHFLVLAKWIYSICRDHKCSQHNRFHCCRSLKECMHTGQHQLRDRCKIKTNLSIYFSRLIGWPNLISWRLYDDACCEIDALNHITIRIYCTCDAHSLSFSIKLSSEKKGQTITKLNHCVYNLKSKKTNKVNDCHIKRFFTSIYC